MIMTFEPQETTSQGMRDEFALRRIKSEAQGCWNF